jgi:hypothetical protein
MRESTQVKHVLQSKGYRVLRVKYAYRERYLLVTLPTEQANKTPRLPGEILLRQLAYNFHGRTPERTWLKFNGQVLLDNEYLIPRADAFLKPRTAPIQDNPLFE